MSGPGRRQGDRGRKAPPRAAPEVLERVALAYLARFAASEAGLRRVLMRRVDRAARAGTVEAEAAAEAGRASVEALIERYRRSGLVDDRIFAEARAASLHRQGASKRAIRAKLAQKGIAADLVEAAITALADVAFEPGDGGVDLAAAVNYARRRRIGPFGHPARRAVRRDRDLAALGRQGFAYDIARRVVDAPDAQAAESLADAAPPVSRRG